MTMIGIFKDEDRTAMSKRGFPCTETERASPSQQDSVERSFRSGQIPHLLGSEDLRLFGGTDKVTFNSIESTEKERLCLQSSERDLEPQDSTRCCRCGSEN